MHDIHIHSSLSKCAQTGSEFADYMAAAAENKLEYIGFSDHLWDSAVPGANSWYAPQDIEHVCKLKDTITACKQYGIKVFFGCECEYIGNNIISLHPDNAEIFDYVLVSANHFHMPFVRSAAINGGKELANLFYTRFKEVCEFDFVTGIAHPFIPIGFAGREKEVLQLLEERELEKCFALAAACNKSVELNIYCIYDMKNAGVLDDYIRILQIARDCGCNFHVGSDAHSVNCFTPERFAFAADIIKQNNFTVKFVKKH